MPKLGAFEWDVPYATSRVPDPRARHFWDGHKAVMRGLEAPLGIQEEVWDCYLLYGPEATWRGAEPPRPVFWMQRMGFPQAPLFDSRAFAARAESLLAHLPGTPPIPGTAPPLSVYNQ